jgi:putative dimethyl sulfoxide reductase chaperone
MDREKRLLLSEVCHLVAVLFYDPQEFLPGVQENSSEYEKIVADVDSALLEIFRSLQQAARVTALNDLRVDYAALFVGPAELRACPYGSVYLEGGRQLYGKTTRAVAEMYSRAGLQVGKDSAFVPDHIAVELEFIHFLLHQAETATPPPAQELYQRFLAHFFLPFAAGLAGAIAARAETDFYRLQGRMLQRLSVLLAATARPGAGWPQPVSNGNPSCQS